MADSTKILLANISDVEGGVEEVATTLAQDIHDHDCWDLDVLVSPTKLNGGFVRTVEHLASECFKISDLASVFCHRLWKEPSAAVSAFRPSIGRPGPRRTWKSRVKQVVPPWLDSSLWSFRQIQRSQVLFEQVLDVSQPAIIHAMAGSYPWFTSMLLAVAKSCPQAKTILHLGNPPVLGDVPYFARRIWRRQATEIVFVSTSIQQAWFNRYPDVSTVPNRVVHNGIDTSRFPYVDRAGRREGDSLFHVGMCSRLSEAKGVDVAIRALHRLVQDFPAVQLHIVGDGHSKASLLTLVDELGLSDHVTFHGHQQNIPKWLASFDVLLQPSRSEAFGLSIAEAMCSGLPVVGTRVGGIPEVVEDGVTGVLVAPEDPEALAHEIWQLAMNPDRCHQLGRAGRDRVLRLFSQKSMCAQFQQLYGEVLNRRS